MAKPEACWLWQRAAPAWIWRREWEPPYGLPKYMIPLLYQMDKAAVLDKTLVKIDRVVNCFDGLPQHFLRNLT